MAKATTNEIIAATPPENVILLLAVEEVVTRATAQGVMAKAAEERVMA